MAISNQERLGRAMELLRNGLAPYVVREMNSAYPGQVEAEALRLVQNDKLLVGVPVADWDVAALFKLMWAAWNGVFGKTLGRSERSLIQELRDFRNDWAHQSRITSDDTDRALDSMERLLTAISAAEADEVMKMKVDLRRQVYDSQISHEKRKAGGSLIEAAVTGSIKPWREVVTPHPDVASGRYQQAEFAADLWQVHLEEGSEEYRDPVEFFRRTYLTESLKQLLVGGARRLAGLSGDPVVQLQTNFGGGKTHSMLALYHLASKVPTSSLPGIDAVMAEAGVTSIPATKRVVLVGNKISPGNPSVKADGTVVRTLWGELAYQLGGKKAYERIRHDDERGTSPGDVLRELFNEYGPSLILVDEWVAYARQLHEENDLPGGTFETQFSFAQALTESAKLASNCLLVISLPASDTAGSPHTNNADDVEVGGIRGREALERLRNVVGRVESSWRPASAEEGFEIVRRRLFENLSGDNFKHRDVTARAFADMYRAQKSEFPPECATSEYEARIKSAYPIHPEIFDRLYTDWSTLVKFQRTRGVLRLMAAVIHSLWDKGDRNALILPSMIPIDDPRVQFELTRYLSDQWAPIIEKDVDGPNSLPHKIDAEQSALGKLHATRRVARTIYLGSAPSTAASQRGIEDRRIKLGCVMPGETVAVFGDALRRLGSLATYLYHDGPRAWYDTQPTVTKLADDRAEQFKRDHDKVVMELEDRVRTDLKTMGDFKRIHALPESGVDVPDDTDARLVVLRAEHGYSKESGNAAEVAAKAILEARGNSPRIYRNSLVFLAADRVRLQDLEDAVRKLMAWESILDEKETLNLGPHQVKQAETQRSIAENRVKAQIPEVYQWLLVPTQNTPQEAVTWKATALKGSDSLAVRVSKRLKADDDLFPTIGPTVLKTYLDKIPLWRGDSVPVRQLVEDFARYPYLPRLSSSEVLLKAIADGPALINWAADAFAIAESFDEATGRYKGLVTNKNVPVYAESNYLLVKPSVAVAQQAAEAAAAAAASAASVATGATGGIGQVFEPTVTQGGAPVAPGKPGAAPVVPSPARPKRYHGTVELDATRVGRDASRIADELISHLVVQAGAKVTVTLEIEAILPEGAGEQLVRTVTENGKSLKFASHGFEVE
jgi:predicted AAA+ superfamily ATPase